MPALNDSVMQPAVTGTKITTSGTSQQTSAISSGLPFTVVRLTCTEDCYVAFGSNPTAAASNMTLPADSVEYFKMNSGDKIAVLQVSASGSFEYTVMV